MHTYFCHNRNTRHKTPIDIDRHTTFLKKTLFKDGKKKTFKILQLSLSLILPSSPYMSTYFIQSKPYSILQLIFFILYSYIRNSNAAALCIKTQ